MKEIQLSNGYIPHYTHASSGRVVRTWIYNFEL